MGYLKERHSAILLGSTPGTCPECAAAHDPAFPHNRYSLTYQYRFYDREGRWPTWDDAMAHCPDEVKSAWRRALAERGIDCSKSHERNPAPSEEGDARCR